MSELKDISAKYQSSALLPSETVATSLLPWSPPTAPDAKPGVAPELIIFARASHLEHSGATAKRASQADSSLPIWGVPPSRSHLLQLRTIFRQVEYLSNFQAIWRPSIHCGNTRPVHLSGFCNSENKTTRIEWRPSKNPNITISSMRFRSSVARGARTRCSLRHVRQSRQENQMRLFWHANRNQKLIKTVGSAPASFQTRHYPSGWRSMKAEKYDSTSIVETI